MSLNIIKEVATLEQMSPPAASVRFVGIACGANLGVSCATSVCTVPAVKGARLNARSGLQTRTGQEGSAGWSAADEQQKVQKCKPERQMIQITTYRELTDFMTAFANGHFNTLVICSEGGMGKSEEVDRVVNGNDALRIVGHLTPLRLYELAYRNVDKPIVFHEIDCLLANPQHVGLLKQLCETRERKKVMWTSTDPRAAQIDGGAGYFYTRSHVLLLCNSFSILNANVGALKTRATLAHFVPSSREILAKTKTFATDDEIIAFLDEFHEAIPEFSLRTYGRLVELKQGGLDWRHYALQQATVSPKVHEIADLMVRYDTDIERVDHYSGSRRDYYNWKPKAKEYLRRQSIVSSKPALKLAGAPLDEVGQLRAAE